MEARQSRRCVRILSLLVANVAAECYIVDFPVDAAGRYFGSPWATPNYKTAYIKDGRVPLFCGTAVAIDPTWKRRRRQQRNFGLGIFHCLLKNPPQKKDPCILLIILLLFFWGAGGC